MIWCVFVIVGRRVCRSSYFLSIRASFRLFCCLFVVLCVCVWFCDVSLVVCLVAQLFRAYMYATSRCDVLWNMQAAAASPPPPAFVQFVCFGWGVRVDLFVYFLVSSFVSAIVGLFACLFPAMCASFSRFRVRWFSFAVAWGRRWQHHVLFARPFVRLFVCCVCLSGRSVVCLFVCV